MGRICPGYIAVNEQLAANANSWHSGTGGDASPGHSGNRSAAALRRARIASGTGRSYYSHLDAIAISRRSELG
jgi:hypothetical protein